MYYMSMKQLSEAHGYSIRHVKDLVREIRGQMDAGRYGRYAVLDDGVLVNVLCFYDYLKYRKALKDPAAAKSVPAFDAGEIAAMCGEVERCG